MHAQSQQRPMSPTSQQQQQQHQQGLTQLTKLSITQQQLGAYGAAQHEVRVCRPTTHSASHQSLMLVCLREWCRFMYMSGTPAGTHSLVALQDDAWMPPHLPHCLALFFGMTGLALASIPGAGYSPT